MKKRQPRPPSPQPTREALLAENATLRGHVETLTKANQELMNVANYLQQRLEKHLGGAKQG